ncbi:MAG: bifunctional hemolysin/adenylate cyclase, partial [Solirubrobacterales bacterium]|nr:bifunctional hemolysin/adenylate cyclase [Solirubrobacterales bacterium]
LGDQLLGEDGLAAPTTGAGGDTLLGRGGDDDLRGDEGDDRLDGGEGSDIHVGGLGADVLEDTGATGTDSVTYKVDAVQSGVRVTVGDGPNDGRDAGLEGDDVRPGFERLQGSSFADVLRGGGTGETINGSDGDDDIDGGGGADTIEGNGGNDVLRAQDGEVDARLDCDAASDPVAGMGAADAAFVDANDPEATRCETVARPGGGAPAPVAPPANTGAPSVDGLRLVDQRLVCSPGAWTGSPSFTYAWYALTATGARTPVASGPVLTVPLEAAGLELECEVAATNPGATTTSRSARSRIAPRTTLQGLRQVARRFPTYTRGTRECGRKGFCEVEEVRRRLEALGVPIRFEPKPVAGLRFVPAEQRASIRPGAVFRTSPKAGASFTAGPGDVERVRVSFYVPDAAADCPLGEVVEVRGGRDYRLNDLLVGLSLRDALKLLRRERCSTADYDVVHRYRRGAGSAPAVTAARDFDEGGRDRVRLTVEHAAPGLQLSLQPVEPRRARLPLRLADDSARSVQLVAAEGQRSSFAVAVATRAGVGLKNVRVELRDAKGDLAGSALTSAKGVATLVADVDDDGAYEVWASASDREGDSLVGWKPLRAVTLKRDFTGLDGVRYRYAKGAFGVAAAARAVGRGAQLPGEDATLTEMREQAATACAASARTRYSSFVSANGAGLSSGEAASVTLASQVVCLFSTGQIDLARMRAAGVTPALATLGGSQDLAVGRPSSTTTTATVFDRNTLFAQPASAIRVGPGALSFVTGDGVTLYVDGTYALQSGGGAALTAKGPAGRVVLDVTAAGFALDLIGPLSVAGIISGGAGNIISNDGASIISGGAGNIISNDGASIISNDGASIISGGGGNVVSTGSGG